jgi:hypothetical protein
MVCIGNGMVWYPLEFSLEMEMVWYALEMTMAMVCISMVCISFTFPCVVCIENGMVWYGMVCIGIGNGYGNGMVCIGIGNGYGNGMVCIINGNGNGMHWYGIHFLSIALYGMHWQLYGMVLIQIILKMT